MNTSRAQDVVILEAVGIGAISLLAHVARGKGFPSGRSILATGALAVGLSVVAIADGETAVALGGLALVGTALSEVSAGKSLVEVALGQAAKGGKPLPKASGPTASDVFASLSASSAGVNAARGTLGAGPAGPLNGTPVLSPVIGGKSSPIAGKFSIIGTPGSGTHSWTAPPNNWESDNALDIAAPFGTPVLAIADGTIGSQIGPLPSSDPRMAGLRVHLDTPGGVQAYYAHLSRLTVTAGQRVKAGQVIGYSGAANGVNHLHFAVDMNHKPQQFYGGN